MSIVTKKLGEIGTYINGCAFKPEDWKTSGVPIIRIENLNSPKAAYNYYQGEFEEKYRVVNGDILVSWSASLDAYVWNRGEAVLNQHIFKVIPNEDLVDKDFLFFLLKKAIKGLTELVHGATMKHVNKPVFENFEVAFPEDKETQRKWAKNLESTLTEIDKAREATEIINQDIKRLKHLALHDFLSEFSETEKFKLGTKAVTTSGSTPSRGQKDYWQPAEIPWIKTGEVDFVPITEAKEYVSAKALKECSLKLLPPNTVLVAMVGQGKTRGKSAIAKISVTINQNCFAILPNATWDAEFLQLWLMYSYQDLRNMSDSRGGNQPNFSCSVLNEVEVPAPLIELQREVVEKINAALTELETMRAIWVNTAEEIKALPNRLLAQAFNEIDNG